MDLRKPMVSAFDVFRRSVDPKISVPWDSTHHVLNALYQTTRRVLLKDFRLSISTSNVVNSSFQGKTEGRAVVSAPSVQVKCENFSVPNSIPFRGHNKEPATCQPGPPPSASIPPWLPGRNGKASHPNAPVESSVHRG